MHRITTFFIFSSSVGSELKNILLLIMSTIYTNIYNIYKYLQYIQISTIYRVSQKKLPFVKIGGGKYYCWQWEIHMKLLQIQVKHQALLWQQVNVWVHMMNLSQIVLLFFQARCRILLPRIKMHPRLRFSQPQWSFLSI